MLFLAIFSNVSCILLTTAAYLPMDLLPREFGARTVKAPHKGDFGGRRKPRQQYTDEFGELEGPQSKPIRRRLDRLRSAAQSLRVIFIQMGDG